MNTVETKGARITFRDDLIIHIHYDEVNFTLEDSKRIFDFTREHCPWTQSPIYLTGGGFTNQDSESNKFNGSQEVTKHCSAIAFLSPNLSQKLLANFFMMIIKPAVPTKAFAKEEDAIAWLKQFKTIPKTS